MGSPKKLTTNDPLPGAHALPVRARNSALATAVARFATYGPRNTETTVVLKAEFAQSYIAQPKISRLSFTVACDVVIVPPEKLFVLPIKTPCNLCKLRNVWNVIE